MQDGEPPFPRVLIDGHRELELDGGADVVLAGVEDVTEYLRERKPPVLEYRSEGDDPRTTIHSQRVDHAVVRDNIGRAYESQTTVLLGLSQTEIEQVVLLVCVDFSVLLPHWNGEEVALRGIQSGLVTVELVDSARLARAVPQALASVGDLTTQPYAYRCNPVFCYKGFDGVVITTPGSPRYGRVETPVYLVTDQVLYDHSHALVLYGARRGCDVRLGPAVVC